MLWGSGRAPWSMLADPLHAALEKPAKRQVFADFSRMLQGSVYSIWDME